MSPDWIHQATITVNEHMYTYKNNYEIYEYWKEDTKIFQWKKTKYIQMHTKKGDHFCNFLLGGILVANGKAIPSNYGANDFWPEILYVVEIAIKYKGILKSFTNK